MGDTCKVFGSDRPQTGTVEKIGRKIITVRVNPYRTYRFDVSTEHRKCLDSDFVTLVTNQEMEVQKSREGLSVLLREAADFVYRCKDIEHLDAIRVAVNEFLGKP